jgi:hypothetical protein
LKQFHQLNICRVIKPALYEYPIVDLQLEDLKKMLALHGPHHVKHLRNNQVELQPACTAAHDGRAETLGRRKSVLKQNSCGQKLDDRNTFGDEIYIHI